MKSILRSNYAGYFLWGLLANIIAAYFSVGYHHPDEHFQILEFANYKLGNTPIGDLPWEFAAKIRPGLQPFIAYSVISLLHSIGVYSPFVITFFFRLLIGISAWFVICKFIVLLIPEFTTPKAKKIFIVLSLFLWFIPYLNVRFSSENTATISFLLAFYLVLESFKSDERNIGKFFWVGILLAGSFFFRFQMAFAIIGLMIWLVYVRLDFKKWLAMISSGLITAIACVYLDKWLYGTWTFTPYNYYLVNIVQHAAANFGTDPWWYYPIMFIITAIPPLSIVLLVFFIFGIYSKPKSAFVFILIPFLIGHSVIGHKEMRFLFPMWFMFVYIASVGIDFIIKRYKRNRFFDIGFQVLIIFNIGVLFYRIIAPAQEAIPVFKFVSNEFKKPTTLFCIEEPLYSLAGLKADFYKEKNIKEIILKDENALDTFLLKNRQDSAIAFKKSAIINQIPSGYSSKRIYCMFPEWVLKFNINNWEDRANIWSLHVLTKNK